MKKMNNINFVKAVNLNKILNQVYHYDFDLSKELVLHKFYWLLRTYVFKRDKRKLYDIEYLFKCRVFAIYITSIYMNGSGLFDSKTLKYWKVDNKRFITNSSFWRLPLKNKIIILKKFTSKVKDSTCEKYFKLLTKVIKAQVDNV